ncbi:hypothetical protein GCM10009557_01460 [Virgisporangium ochraceum]|uniref:Uncharacterized protein n=1 Tax=Virgisporangium ochraceum TaxID=65505 RepID=A0A8J4A1Q7_9ACTN|nr:hypothetical protein Voc01_090940 [Virgisporangium ochraceum]
MPAPGSEHPTAAETAPRTAIRMAIRMEWPANWRPVDARPDQAHPAPTATVSDWTLVESAPVPGWVRAWGRRTRAR